MSAPWTLAFDVVKLGGRQLPGVWRVSVTSKDCLDRQKPRGRKKSRTRDDGDKPVEFLLEGELTAGDLPTFKSFWSMLHPRGKTAARDPVACVHPFFTLADVKALSIGDVNIPGPKSGDSIVVRIQAFEWTPEATEVRKPKETPTDKEDADGWDIPLRELPPSQAPSATP